MKRHFAPAVVAVTVVLAASGCGGSSSGGGSGGDSAAPQPSDTAPTSVATAVSGKLTITPPSGWRRLDDQQQKDSYHLVISGTCGYDGAAQLSGCHSVHVFGASYVAPNPDSDNALPIQPYNPDEPHAGQYLQDNGYECPADKKLRAATKKQGAKLIKQTTAQVGGKTAQYREWEIPCWTKDPESGQPKAKSGTVYTERDWYVTDEKVLIVDEWKTAALQGLLTKATWG